MGEKADCGYESLSGSRVALIVFIILGWVVCGISPRVGTTHRTLNFFLFPCIFLPFVRDCIFLDCF